jgi:hypothetical protein
MRILLLSAALATAFAQSGAVFEDRPALIVANSKLELTVMTEGGALVNLVLRDDPAKLSPLWNPARIAREAGKPARFGNSRGHFVCVDGFGPVSKEEQAAGLPGHGEAHTLPWETVSHTKSGAASVLVQSVKMPAVQETLTRTIRIVDPENVVYVHSELENLMGFDRPVNWAEHATIGSPFLEAGVTVVDISAGPSKTRRHSGRPGGLPHRLASFEDFTWPNAPAIGGGAINVRAAPKTPNSGDHTTTALDPSRKLVFVTALHPVKRLLLGYVFKREESPWIQTWENYVAPNEMARGLEFGTQPFDLPRREVISTGSMFGVPTYRWLPAKSKISSDFLIFYTRTPESFAKVDDVRMEGGELRIEDRAAGKRITLKASLPL